MDIFVPGRLAILGEHTDWICSYRDANATLPYGLCLVCATNEGIYAKANVIDGNSNSSLKLIFSHAEKGTYNVPLEASWLEEEAQKGSFFSYVAGAAASVLETCFSEESNNIKRLRSVHINNYTSTLPTGKGLSSSAACSVLVVRAFNELFNLNLSKDEIMAIAYRGERKTRSECGMMDFCVVMGPGAIGAMVMSEGGYCHLNLIPNETPLHFVVADLKANPPKNTVEILSSLNKCFPLPLPAEEAHLCRMRLKMHDYAHDSLQLCLDSTCAIEMGRKGDLAASMTAAQASFDHGATTVCPAQLTSPFLHRAIDELKGVPGVLAAKGVGSQGDGSVQILCEDERAQSLALARLKEPDLGAEAFLLTLPAWSATIGNLELSTSSPPRQSSTRVREAILIICDKQGVTGCKMKTAYPSTIQIEDAVAALIASGIEEITILAPASCDDLGFLSDEPSASVSSAPLPTSSSSPKEGALSDKQGSAVGEHYGHYLRQSRFLPSCHVVRYNGGSAVSSHSSSFLSTLQAAVGASNTHVKEIPRGRDSPVLLIQSDAFEGESGGNVGCVGSNRGYNYTRGVFHLLQEYGEARQRGMRPTKSAKDDDGEGNEVATKAGCFTPKEGTRAAAVLDIHTLRRACGQMVETEAGAERPLSVVEIVSIAQSI